MLSIGDIIVTVIGSLSVGLFIGVALTVYVTQKTVNHLVDKED